MNLWSAYTPVQRQEICLTPYAFYPMQFY